MRRETSRAMGPTAFAEVEAGRRPFGEIRVLRYLLRGAPLCVCSADAGRRTANTGRFSLAFSRLTKRSSHV